MDPSSELSSSQIESGPGSKATGSSVAKSGLPISSTVQDAGVCVFSVDGRTFAVDTALVGEVVAIDQIRPVPGAPRPILGLFSLRGAPLAVVDLMLVLGQPSRAGHERVKTLLVLRPNQNTLAALRIDRLDAVVAQGRGTKRPFDAAPDHPATVGFFEYGAPHPAVTLGTRPLLEALMTLSFSNQKENV